MSGAGESHSPTGEFHRTSYSPILGLGKQALLQTKAWVQNNLKGRFQIKQGRRVVWGLKERL